jgi:hypothetical protein
MFNAINIHHDKGLTSLVTHSPLLCSLLPCRSGLDYAPLVKEKDGKVL